jgi:hypothetical protein
MRQSQMKRRDWIPVRAAAVFSDARATARALASDALRTVLPRAHHADTTRYPCAFNVDVGRSGST